jgi:drug/metabolite transporter (DMT)-like permease
VGELPWRLRGIYASIGLVVAVHWVTFYASIKRSNASVAATCIALAPVFLALIEPWVQKSRVDRGQILLGLLVVPGVWLVGGSLPSSMMTGLVLGIASAVFVSFFAALNKLHVHRADPLAITCLELGTGTVALTLAAPFVPHDGAAIPVPGVHDGGLLLLLAVVCTLLPFTLSLVALRHLSAFAAQLAVNLEPVYAIILAALLLGETKELRPRFYVGVLVILSAVLVPPLARLSRARASR